jgi:hypothetical protein
MLSCAGARCRGDINVCVCVCARACDAGTILTTGAQNLETPMLHIVPPDLPAFPLPVLAAVTAQQAVVNTYLANRPPPSDAPASTAPAAAAAKDPSSVGDGARGAAGDSSPAVVPGGPSALSEWAKQLLTLPVATQVAQLCAPWSMVMAALPTSLVVPLKADKVSPQQQAAEQAALKAEAASRAPSRVGEAAATTAAPVAAPAAGMKLKR